MLKLFTGKNRLIADQRRALKLLANSPHGMTEALLLAHSFQHEMMTELVLAGLATVASEILSAGGMTMAVERYRITDAGRNAIEG
jgi:hypothetical protein